MRLYIESLNSRIDLRAFDRSAFWGAGIRVPRLRGSTFEHNVLKYAIYMLEVQRHATVLHSHVNTWSFEGSTFGGTSIWTPRLRGFTFKLNIAKYAIYML